MKRVFVDTSALFALFAASDRAHPRAVRAFERLRELRAPLTTTSYVLVETYALLRSRLGAAAERDFRTGLAPLLNVVWVDADLHERGLDELQSRRARTLSLVDAVSFTSMRDGGIEHALAFDRHFAAEGYRLP